MSERTPVERQVERILDERPEREVEVIVQMESGRDNLERLEQAATEGLHRRRFSQSPRELLPLPYQRRPSKQDKQETASTSVLLGKAATETLALARIQRMGLQTIHPLLQNGIVREALARMAEPARKGAPANDKVSRFWTSRSVPLRLKRDELRDLWREVESIRAIHVNRRLSLPPLQETRQHAKETEDLLVSTWGIEKIRALAVWGAYGIRGKSVTIGLLDTGVDPQDRAAAFSGGRTMVLRECDYIDPKYLPLLYSKPDLSAPGVAIYSSVPGGGWKAMSGTSMASPHVAGAIALLLSATTIRKKESGAHRAFLISDLITGSVEDLGESGQDHRYGFGRLDVLRAIDFARERGY